MVLGHCQGTVVQMFKRERNANADPDPEEEVGDHQQGGNGHDKLAHEVLEELSADISRHWLGGYVGLETLPGIAGTAMLGVSAAEMMLGTAVRMSVLYAWKGPGPWMAAAIWSTAFQVVIMPSRWALEWGRNQGEMIAQAMEARVGGANLPIDGGGTSPDNNRN
jgi:hypothetical protein